MKVGSGPSLTWFAGAFIGVFAGFLLVSWLPLLLKAAVISLVALVLNVPGTSGSRGLQAGFLVAVGGVAFIVLMTADVLAGPLAALAVAILALGFWRTLEFVDLRRSV